MASSTEHGLPSRLRPAAAWLSEAFRLSIDRAGHLFTIIVVVSFPIDLLAAALTYAGARDLVITIADDNSVTASGVSPWLGVAAVALLAGTLAKALVGVAAARHVLAARTGVPESWSDTLHALVPRLPRIVGAIALFALAFTAVYLAVIIVLGAIAAIVPPLGVLLVIGAIVALLGFVGRFGLGPVATGVAPPGFGGLRRSFGLTKGFTRPLLGRLTMLITIGFMMLLIASIFTSPFLSGGAVDLSERPVVLDDLAGDNPFGSVAGQAISSLVLGALAALTGAAFGLLFADLGGPLDPSITDVDPNGADAPWPDPGPP